MTSPNAQIFPIFPQKLDSSSAGGALCALAGALTTFPCKFGPKQFFLCPGGCTCTQCTPGYAYVFDLDYVSNTRELAQYSVCSYLSLQSDQQVSHNSTSRNQL